MKTNENKFSYSTKFNNQFATNKVSSDLHSSNLKSALQGSRLLKKACSTIKRSNQIEQEYVLAIIENYSREVGISAFNLSTHEVFTTQIIDNEAYVNTITLINLWSPYEIVMNEKSKNNTLNDIIKKLFPKSTVVYLPRKDFSETYGKELYLSVNISELSKEDLNKKYVCTASLSGLINHLDYNDIKLDKKLMRIKYYYLDNCLNIPYESVISLELLFNSKYKTNDYSLISLFKTRTVSGYRLLRANLLQPSSDVNELKRRYDAIEEINSNEANTLLLKQKLEEFKYFEFHINKFVKQFDYNDKEALLNDIQMRQYLVALKYIKDAVRVISSEDFQCLIKRYKSGYFYKINVCFSDIAFAHLVNKLNDSLEEIDLSKKASTNKSDFIYFLIKEKMNNLFDITRDTYSDTINEVYTQFSSIKEVLNLPQLKLNFSESKGYYFILSENSVLSSKIEFAICKKIGKKFHCSTSAIVSLSERLFELRRELNKMTFNILSDLIIYVQTYISYLYIASSHIALIDFIISLADFSSEKDFPTKLTRPIINTKGIVNIKNSKNPLMFLLKNKDYNIVSNDLFVDKSFNTLLIKGPNASGKTTFMKQIGLLIILAQVGCFVPCEYITFSPRKFLFTKFQTEGINIDFINSVIDIDRFINTENISSSLLLLDEPVDNSINKINFSIAVALINQLLKVKDSIILITSHNHLLGNIICLYPNSIPSLMKFQINDDTMNFGYKLLIENCAITLGNVKKEDVSYGIKLAKMIGFDSEIIELAEKLSVLYTGQLKYLNKFIPDIKTLTPFLLLKTFIYDISRRINDIEYLKLFLHADSVNEFIKEIKEMIKSVEITN